MATERYQNKNKPEENITKKQKNNFLKQTFVRLMMSY
jgi:hypothetical protein